MLVSLGCYNSPRLVAESHVKLYPELYSGRSSLIKITRRAAPPLSISFPFLVQWLPQCPGSGPYLQGHSHLTQTSASSASILHSGSPSFLFSL